MSQKPTTIAKLPTLLALPGGPPIPPGDF